jgi:hypothetical protein
MQMHNIKVIEERPSEFFGARFYVTLECGHTIDYRVSQLELRQAAVSSYEQLIPRRMACPHCRDVVMMTDDQQAFYTACFGKDA